MDDIGAPPPDPGYGLAVCARHVSILYIFDLATPPPPRYLGAKNDQFKLKVTFGECNLTDKAKLYLRICVKSTRVCVCVFKMDAAILEELDDQVGLYAY